MTYSTNTQSIRCQLLITVPIIHIVNLNLETFTHHLGHYDWSLSLDTKVDCLSQWNLVTTGGDAAWVDDLVRLELLWLTLMPWFSNGQTHLTFHHPSGAFAVTQIILRIGTLVGTLVVCTVLSAQIYHIAEFTCHLFYGYGFCSFCRCICCLLSGYPHCCIQSLLVVSSMYALADSTPHSSSLC
jgi:hypothetical protein